MLKWFETKNVIFLVYQVFLCTWLRKYLRIYEKKKNFAAKLSFLIYLH